MSYTLENGVLSAIWAELKTKKKKTNDENGKPIEVKEFYTVETTKTKSLPALISPAELDLLIGTYIYSYIESNGLPIHTMHLISALLELKEKRSKETG